MEKSEVLKCISEVGLVPVIRAESKDGAIRVIDAIAAGGLPILEVTMTVPGALSIIEAIRKRDASAIVGAGTVLDAETARACILVGASFIVSPSLNLATIEMCRRYSVAVMPGCLTPTEVVQAWTAGADVVKVFPCGAMGGASYIKALKAPFPQIPLMPTFPARMTSPLVTRMWIPYSPAGLNPGKNGLSMPVDPKTPNLPRGPNPIPLARAWSVEVP